ncbi:MAG: MarR family transcriptional regulator [Solobacterium sp.]|nr:MarR family transcriptional regulator [Solobacterium sp.]
MKPDSPCLENMLCFPLYAASRKVINYYTPLLKPFGLTYTQYLVLIVLWETDGLTIGELCRKLYLDSGTITPMIKKMEKEGLVERHRCEQDERSVRVSLTDKGKDLEEKLIEVPGKVAVQLHIDPQDALQMYQTLYTILN